ncbi:MAG: hypothetical protein ABI680_06055 [Chthoniobacteraceae bacterium]
MTTIQVTRFNVRSITAAIAAFCYGLTAYGDTSTDFPGELGPAIAADLRQLLERQGTSSAEVRRAALHAWYLENAPRFKVLEEAAQAEPHETLEDSYPRSEPVEVPADVTPKLRLFIIEESALRMSLIDLLRGLGGASPDQRRDALKEWEERTEDQRAALEKIAAAAAEESPPTIDEPPAAGSGAERGPGEEKQFRTEQLALLNEFNAVVRQNANATSASRRAAFYHWHMQNLERFRNQQELANEIEKQQKQ